MIICLLITSTCYSQSWLSYLNKLRTLTGLSAFQENQLIDKAAQNHALYLSYNQIISHYETPSYPFYTGVTPLDRLKYVGYNPIIVMENISAGENNATSSIDDLFSAIYHRLAFLEPSLLHIGFGQSKDTRGVPYYVFDMATPMSLGYDGYTSLLQSSPEVVIWPANGATVPPHFYNTEDPNPLPSMLVTGYPISFSFNNLLVSKVELIDFKLTDGTGKSISATEMTSYSDPNGQLNQNQFVFFPISRLNWATKYEVKATFRVNNKIKTYIISFRTRKPPYPLYIVDKEGLNLPIKSGKFYTLYFPPPTPNDLVSSIKYSYTYGTDIDVQFFDSNTLNIKATGPLGGKITIVTPYRTVTLTISKDDYAVLFEDNPQTDTANLLPPPLSKEIIYIEEPYNVPVKISDSLMYVDLHYTAPVNMIVGILSCDFSEFYTLREDCRIDRGFSYIQATDLHCDSVPLPISGGTIFWLVTVTPLEEFNFDYHPYTLSLYHFGICP